MNALSDIFCAIALEEFHFLVSEFGFTAKESVTEQWSCVDFDSEKVTIQPYWDYRDGTDLGIIAKVDTFWIRPASTHGYNLRGLLQMVAPTVLNQFPQVNSRAKTEENLRPILAFYAKQLWIYGEPILKGDLSLCEDMLITDYCQTAKSIPMDDYFKVFREECASLPVAERERLEVALATRSRLEIWPLLEEFCQKRKVVTPSFLTAAHNFWLQHMR